jgi:putative addiction module CopG family antidote
MNVSVTPPFEDYIRRKLETGAFASPQEVVEAGLQLLQAQDNWAGDARRKIDEGWSQAKSGQLLDPDQVHRNLAARKAAWRERTHS